MIYLNNAAGDRPYTEVIDTIVDILTNHWGNPHDDTSFGHDAKIIINDTTQTVANDMNCSTNEIIWTSGACEANSLALHGAIDNKYMCLYTTKLEHTSIQKMLSKNFYNFIRNDDKGFIDINDLENQLMKCSPSLIPIVSITAANSEIGTIQPIKEIAEIVHKYNGVYHVDATQLYPERKLDVKELGIDLMSVSGQKLHCVKGIGVLYVKDGIKIEPIIYGSQQNGIRGGTLSTHLITAFGKALEITRQENKTSNI